MTAEPYRDSIHISADPESVFDYFVNPRSLVRWMGDEAVLDPRPGGQFTLTFGDRTVEGRYLHVDPPRRVVISWGRRGSLELPPQSSVLEVELIAENNGTRVNIVHTGLPDSEYPRHAAGWRFYLARLVIAADGADPGPHSVPRSLTDGAD